MSLNALTTCNSCEAAPMAEGQEQPGQPGYCAECLSEITGHHVHDFGSFELARFTGMPVRRCLVASCRFVSLDSDDDEMEEVR